MNEYSYVEALENRLQSMEKLLKSVRLYHMGGMILISLTLSINRF